MTCLRLLALDFIRFRYCFCCGFKSVSPKLSRKPIAPLSGVRISWLIEAKKLSFAFMSSRDLTSTPRKSASISDGSGRRVPEDAFPCGLFNER